LSFAILETPRGAAATEATAATKPPASAKTSKTAAPESTSPPMVVMSATAEKHRQQDVLRKAPSPSSPPPKSSTGEDDEENEHHETDGKSSAPRRLRPGSRDGHSAGELEIELPCVGLCQQLNTSRHAAGETAGLNGGASDGVAYATGLSICDESLSAQTRTDGYLRLAVSGPRAGFQQQHDTSVSRPISRLAQSPDAPLAADVPSHLDSCAPAQVRQRHHHDLTPGFLAHFLDQDLHPALIRRGEDAGEVIHKPHRVGQLQL
jgi:hypothetical protein